MSASVKIIFANNDELTLTDSDLIQVIYPIPVDSNNDQRNEALKNVTKEQMTISEPIDLSDYHVKFGLVPDLLSIFHHTEYFFIAGKPETIYMTSSIVKIENLF